MAGRRSRNGKFFFEKNPGQPIRFYGVNLSSSANFLEKEACRRLADRLAACGYNSVRIHHHDRMLTQKRGGGASISNQRKWTNSTIFSTAAKRADFTLTTDL